MRKLITSFIALAFVLSGPALAFAETTTTTNTNVSDVVQQLLDQLKSLETQLQTLKDAQSQVQTAKTSVLNTLKIVRNLSQGMTGDDVTTLQTILASDPSIYPEGLVTGFYGQLTSNAVKNFQKKHGIDALGFVGPLTRAALNGESENLGLSEGEGDSNEGIEHGNGKILCTKVPPGHLIAPGWLKKHDGERPVVPDCQTLPQGITNILNGKDREGDDDNGTTTPDTTAPVLSNIAATSTATTSVRISWQTNELASSDAWLSTTTPVDITDAMHSTVPGNVKYHILNFSGLATSTTYYYFVVSADASGNTATSSQSSITTLGE